MKTALCIALIAAVAAVSSWHLYQQGRKREAASYLWQSSQEIRARRNF
jgi:hypothetical protein